MALQFSRSADFPVHKEAGVACPHLRSDYRCQIHTDLRPRGYVGCTVFDCQGAGQRATALFAPRSWHAGTDVADAQFEVFSVLRQLHEMLWYLIDAIDRIGVLGQLESPPGRAENTPGQRDESEQLRRDLQESLAHVQRIAAGDEQELRTVDTATLRGRVGPALRRASSVIRGPGGPNLRDRDLAGHDLSGKDLRGADLSGALLLGADLSNADLRDADLLAADLRGANLTGARLDCALYLTTAQVASARSDRTTTLPPWIPRPAK